MKRRAVLVMNTSAAIGGTNRVVQALALGLAGRGVAVRALIPDEARSAATLAWFERSGVRAEAHPAAMAMEAPHDLASMARLRRLVRDCGASAVNIHYGYNYVSLKDVLAVRSAGGARCVASVHGLTPWGEFGPRKRRATRLAARLCHAIVAPSEASRRVVLDAGVPARRVHVIPNGARARPTPICREEARRQLGLPERAFVVASCSRLVPGKGLPELVDAAARVSGVHLAVAGDGPERAALEGRAAAAGLGTRARFLGHLDDVDVLYAAADVFALPSHSESFGLVFAEAALHGVPSIGACVGGVPEVISDGVTGVLVPPGDVDTLAGAICRLRDDAALRASMGGAALARARSEFVEEAMIDRYERVLLP